jgi:hypothetical protein
MNLITIGQAEVVLNRLKVKKPDEFSSHDFIEEYSLWREDDYIDWLNSYRGTGKALWHVHTDIGTFLGAQEGKLTPRYHRIGRKDSENAHGMIDKPMWWAWD